MPKDLESLEKSREIRRQVIAKYGFIPTSVLEIDYSWGKHIIEYEERKQQAKATEKHKKMSYNIKTYETQNGETKSFNQELSQWSMSSQNVRGKDGGLSTFPPGLAKFIVDFYSNKGDLIGDCFCGHNSRCQVSYELGRSYWGWDINSDFMAFNRKVAQEIQGKGNQPLLFKDKTEIKFFEETSEKMNVPDETFDMIFTSPPYGIEDYGDHPLQIGGHKESYPIMIKRLTVVLLECYRTLKKDKFCIWNINDFRKDNIFYPFHADIIRAFQQIGFKLHDIVVVKWQSCIGQAFASQVESRKICSKAHEYLVVGKK